MEFKHGVYARQANTSVATPIVAETGIAFVVGTAPVHSVGGKVNEVVHTANYADAVTKFGYHDDWTKYSLCEVIYTHYQLYRTSPVIFVNVLDPAKHKKQIAPTKYTFLDNQVKLPFETIADTVAATGYTKGTDFDVFYQGSSLIVERLDGGAIPANAEIEIGYAEVDPSLVTKEDIIGGFDIQTKTRTGFELVDNVFTKYSLIPDILISPGWSKEPEVAAVMNIKAEKINGLFEGLAIVDIDTSKTAYYMDVPEQKKAGNLNFKNQVVCYPMCKLGDKVSHMSSHLAAIMATVDKKHKCPCESPSNKTMCIDSTVVGDKEELLDITQANYLNAKGIVTAINMMGSFVAWGSETACYPYSTEVKDYFIPVSRMFAWVANTLILSYWSQVDSMLNNRMIDSVMQDINMWLNGLSRDDKLYGARIEFRQEENPDTAIASGKAVFHIFMAPPSPAKEIEFILEYDKEYSLAALRQVI